MRCVTLANELLKHGLRSSFLCRKFDGSLNHLIVKSKFKLIELQSTSKLAPTVNCGTPFHHRWLGVNWEDDAAECMLHVNEKVRYLVVDHYALDSRWEEQMSTKVDKIIVMDDLADRPHLGDLLIDQNIGRSRSDYLELLSPKTKTLLGPHFALLRPEFRNLRDYSLNRRLENSKLEKLFVNFGGVDSENITAKVIKSLEKLSSFDLKQVIVVAGHSYKFYRNLEQMCASISLPISLYRGVNNMAALMAECDLAIGASGSTTWERCCLGLPTIQIVLAENQQHVAEQIRDRNAGEICDKNEVSSQILNIVESFFEQQKLSNFTKNCAQLVDGLGTSRVVENILNINQHENAI